MIIAGGAGCAEAGQPACSSRLLSGFTERSRKVR
jgi:hypothetical protein